MDVFDLQGKISLDTSGFTKAVKEAKKSGQDLGKDLQSQSKQFVELQKELGRLANELDDAQKEIERLKTQLGASTKATDSNADSTNELTNEMKKAKKAIDDTSDSTEDLGKEEKKTTGQTNDYSESAEKAKDKSHNFAKALGTLGSAAADVGGKVGALASAVKDTLVKATEIGVAAVGAASAGIAALTKQSVSAYGQYEQLKGGAQKIFADMDYSIIAKDAANAYKELNMSQSEYLESINLAGATFSQTMGAERGYNTARKGMLAISDFASGTGKSLTELNQKYQLITRSAASYQSIADQFAGILPQTSADFLEQAQSAGLLSTEYKKLTEVPVAEYQEAVTAMIEKGVAAQGLSQNALRESTTTLTGSIAMTKKAWENLVAGLADPDADLGLLVENFAESAAASAENILPTIENALSGISKAIDILAPKIINGLPGAFKRVGPPLLKAAVNLVGTIGEAIVKGAPQLLPYLKDLLVKVKDLIVHNAGTFFTTITDIITEAAKWITDNLDEILDAAGEILGAIGKGIMDNLPKLLDSAVAIVSKLASYIGDALPELIPAAIAIIGDLAKELTKPERLQDLVDAGFDIINGLISGFFSQETLDFLAEDVPKVITNIITVLTSEETLNQFKDAADAAIDKLIEFLTTGENWLKIGEAAVKIITELAAGMRRVLWMIEDIGNEAVAKFLDKFGLGDAYRKGYEYIKEFRQGMEDALNPATKLKGLVETTGDIVVEKGELKENVKQAAGSGENPNKSKGKTVGDNFDVLEMLTGWLPGHAKGGIITRPEIAMIGEDGPEAVIPLERNTEWIDRVAERLNGGGMTIQTVNINMEGMKIASDYDTERFVEILSERLESLRTAETRAVGGVIW